MNRAQLEQRIVNPDLTDTAVARRDIRALPVRWPRSTRAATLQSGHRRGHRSLATYDLHDARLAGIAARGGGERIMSWQEEDADGNRQGLTIAEAGEPGGPGMGGCPAGPLQSGPAGPTDLAVNRSGATAAVTWTPAVAVPGTPAITGYEVVARGRS